MKSPCKQASDFNNMVPLLNKTTASHQHSKIDYTRSSQFHNVNSDYKDIEYCDKPQISSSSDSECNKNEESKDASCMPTHHKDFVSSNK